jgi:hypothetical protein
MEKIVLEVGQYVALVLLASWLCVIVVLMGGKTKVSQFAAISTVMTLFVPFFWLSGEITELTISRVGSLKTNLEQASKYVDEIKALKIETQKRFDSLQTEAEASKKEINTTIEQILPQQKIAETAVTKITESFEEAEKISAAFRAM